MAKKVLVCDDDENILLAVSHIVEKEGYEVVKARDGNESIKIALAEKPRLIILDLMMPEKTGYEVCEELRKDPTTKDTYIILLTARGKPLSEHTGMVKGANEFMVKPFDPRELREKIQKILA
ncbi:MAG: response regulator [Deltaproteobacteria bacterium]|nr:MAG: response regulator [Deltaproteobacteria bacterium]